MTIPIDFVITCLGAGGAERMLLKLLGEIDRRLIEPRVITLTDYGERSTALAERFAAIDVEVVGLGMSRGIPGPQWIWRLARLLRQRQPQLVNTWMYHADLLGGLAAKLAGSPPVVWNIRNTTLEPGRSKATTIRTVQLCARLSTLLPQRIICCAERAQSVHVALGYDAGKTVIIPNGFPLDTFRPLSGARQSIRRELNIPAESLVIGYVARFDPQKDHQNFLAAAQRLRTEHKQVHFVLCGDHISWDNPELCNWLNTAGLTASTRLLGHRDDIPRLLSAFDIATSASCYGEAFPNAIGEAMACAVPCAVTDVGDSALIVGNTGKIVPPGNPVALCNAWKELAALSIPERSALGWSARQRVMHHFSLPAVTRAYEQLFLNVLGHPAAGTSKMEVGNVA